MRPTTILSAAALLGGLLCTVLLVLDSGGLHVTGGALACADEGCALAAQSPWSRFPPALGPIATLPGVPVAALALALFVALALFAALERRLSRALSTVTAAGALAYLAIGLATLETPCRLCLGSHAAALTLVLLAWRPRTREAQRARRSLVGALLGGAAVAAAVVLVCRPNTEQLLADWRSAPRIQVGGARLVVFSDLECATCRAFHRFALGPLLALEPDLAPRLRHRPLTAVHPSAEDAARSLEAARAQGCLDAALTLLLEESALLAAPPEQLAARLGLDAERFARDRGSPAVAERLALDRAAADAAGVTAVPTVFLDGRRVPARAHTWAPFWRVALGAAPAPETAREGTGSAKGTRSGDGTVGR